MKKLFLGYCRPCDVITMLGIISSCIGMLVAASGHYVLAAVCLWVYGLCDAFDGVVARKHKYEKNAQVYGVQLDSLSDIICSGIFPAFVTALLSRKLITYIVCIFYVLCGVVRLAYFNMRTQDETAEKNVFIGVPITFVTLVYPPVLIILTVIKVECIGPVMTGMLAVLAFAFIANFKVKKVDIPALLKKISRK